LAGFRRDCVPDLSPDEAIMAAIELFDRIEGSRHHKHEGAALVRRFPARKG
jgi:hypothetical protein